MSLLWLVWRALIAITLMLGYYVLGITLGGGLIYLSYYLFSFDDIFLRGLFYVCSFAGTVILFSLPGRNRFHAPGPRLEPREQPRLFETLNKLALRVGQETPDEIYLTAEVRVWIIQRGGFMGFGSRRVMAIGFPLIQFLTVSQLEAALVHEFGHLHAADTWMLPWIHRTQTGIERTIAMMSFRQQGKWLKFQILRLPFVWYGNLFMRTTQAILRIQEFSADRLAANTAGAVAFAEALRTINRNQTAFDHYFFDEVVTAVRHGYHPPLMGGYTLYREFCGKTFDEVRTHPYDRYPPLTERLAAIEHLPAGKAEDCSPALSLLDKVPELEIGVLVAHALDRQEELQPISWEEASRRVMLAEWRRLSRLNSYALCQVTLDSLPSTVARLDDFAQRTLAPRGQADLTRYYAEEVLVSALGYALWRDGWYIDYRPGYLWMRLDDAKINPRHIIEGIRSPEFTKEKWREMLKSLQLDPALSLAPPTH